MAEVDTSKYKEVQEKLRCEILGGRYSASIALPSAMTLAKRFRTTRATVRRALERLRNDGLVGSRRGSGTFITEAARSRTIGLIVPDHGRSEFFPAIVKEISRLAQKEGYLLLLGEVSAKTDKEKVQQVVKLAKDFVEQRVAGVIYQPIDYIEDSVAANRKVLSLFAAAEVPVVLCDYDYVDSPARSGYDVVGVNNVEAGAALVAHLLEAGASNVHFHLRPFAPRSHKNLIRGAVAAYRDRARTVRGDNVLTCEPEDADAVRRHCRKYRPDAFVCGNDSTAAHLKNTLGKIGLNVPQDIMLTGVNDLQIASLLTPPLTTMHISCEQIAETAFYRLLARMANPTMPATEVFLPVQLVARGSTARVKK